MNLREPKKKYRVKLKPQPPFPITIGEDKEWTTYTAHLTYMGACIIDPIDIHAVHSMGFFGKGSLSRSYASFGKGQYGAPPMIRNRQWIHRQEWMEQVKELSIETDNNKNPNLENVEAHTNGTTVQENNTDQEEKEVSEDSLNEHTKESALENRGTDKDDVALVIDDTKTIDSSEEDEISVVLNKATKEGSERNSTLTIINNKQEFFSLIQDNMDESDSRGINPNLQNKLLVLPDSDSENEEYLKNIKPRIESESYPIQETLQLTYEETFFLLYGLGCLNLVNFDGTLLSIDAAWHFFCKTDKHFVQKYVVYHYFRSKGWVVKPGLKYGGDFLLYKQGPPFYHASYIVIVDVIDVDTLVSIPCKSMRHMSWNNLLGLERLSETAAKEILFAQVLWPSSVSLDTVPPNPDVLSEFTVKELLWRRWNPKQNKNTDREDDGEDSS